MVDPPGVLDHPVGAVARQVAGAVHPLPSHERAGDETLGSQPRTLVVATGQAPTGQVQLAEHAHRYRLQVAIEDVAGQVGDRPADRHRVLALLHAGPVGDVDGRLGRAIEVIEAGLRQLGEHLLLELLAQARQRALEAQAHQDLPFEQLVEALQPERSLSHNPLFQVLFNYQSEARGNGQAFRFDELQMESVQFDSRTAQFDLTLDLTDEEQRFCAVFDYATDLFDASTVERLAGHWRNLLRGIVANPRQRLGELPLLQQRQLAEPLSWVGDDAAQQVAPMAGQAFHGGGVEQIGGIVEGGPDAVFVFLNIQRQVELRSLAVPGQAFQTQVLQLNLGRHRAYLALMVEQHLEQWVMAGIALRLQGFHQLLERQVLVRLGLQRALAGLCQQLRFSTPSWLRVLISVMSMFSESTTAVCSSVAVATDWFIPSISAIRPVTLLRRSPARLAISTLSRL